MALSPEKRMFAGFTIVNLLLAVLFGLVYRRVDKQGAAELVLLAVLMIALLVLAWFAMRGVFRDITARKDAQQNLERFFTLCGEPLAIGEFNGHIKRVNPAFIDALGWSEQELVTWPFLKFVHVDDRATTLSPASRVGP